MECFEGQCLVGVVQSGLIEVDLCPTSGVFQLFEGCPSCPDMRVPSVLGKVLDFGL